jgi:hypothetical protein
MIDYKGEKIVAQKITQNYATKGNGILEIDENKNLLIYLEDVEEPVNLADLLTKYDSCEVKFSFAYDVAYEADSKSEDMVIDKETGEILE